MKQEVCRTCGKKKVMLDSHSLEINGRGYSVSGRRACQECLTLEVWTFYLANHYENIKFWQAYAKLKGLNPQILEYRPTYAKVLSVLERKYEMHNCVHESFEVGFKMNGEDWTGVISVYKGDIEGMSLVKMHTWGKTYDYSNGTHTTEWKIVKIVEKQLVPKLVKRMEQYVEGTEWRGKKMRYPHPTNP